MCYLINNRIDGSVPVLRKVSLAHVISFLPCWFSVDRTLYVLIRLQFGQHCINNIVRLCLSGACQIISVPFNKCTASLYKTGLRSLLPQWVYTVRHHIWTRSIVTTVLLTILSGSWLLFHPCPDYIPGTCPHHSVVSPTSAWPGRCVHVDTCARLLFSLSGLLAFHILWVEGLARHTAALNGGCHCCPMDVCRWP